MTKVTLRESAVAEVKPAAPVKDTVTDSKGRVITLRKLDPIAQSRLVRALGNENESYMTSFVYPAAMVESIDEDSYGLPTSVPQIEAMLKILGEHGIKAIGEHFKEKFEKENIGDDGEAAKN
jgi:hypothetical protein